MARLVERMLVWIAGLVTVAVAMALVVNLVPAASGPVHWLRNLQEARLSPQPAIDLAERALQAGDSAEAQRLAGEAVATDSSNSVVDNRAGNIALRTGANQSAERYYLAGEVADPRYAWNFIALGQLYQREGKREQADAQLRAGAGAAPAMPFIHYNLGVVELQEHLYAAALADFETELKVSPGYKPALNGRAEALDSLGRRGEAVALYQRTGARGKPKLSVHPLNQPSPSPSPSPTNSPSPSPSPSVSPSPQQSPIPKPSPTRLVQKRPRARSNAQLAQTAVRSSEAAAQAVLSAQSRPQARPPWDRPAAVAAGPSSSEPAVRSSPTSESTRSLSAVIADAKGYVLGVAQDLNFTRALPPADPNVSTPALLIRLKSAVSQRSFDVESALQVGTAALLSGRLGIAETAFSSVADGVPRDWRGPYLAGLTAQAAGENRRARQWFTETNNREARPEAYVSLAILALENSDNAGAASNARKATSLDPSYVPGRFVAGMIDLMLTNVRGAERNLSAAVALGGAPSRTGYFLSALHQSVGQTAGLPGD